MLKTLSLYKPFPFLIIIFWLSGPSAIKAQQLLQFGQPMYQVNSGTKLQANLRILNINSAAVSFKLTVKAAPFQIIGSVPTNIKLAAGDSLLIPVQLYIPRRINADSTYYITAEVGGENSSITRAAIIVNPERNVFLQPKDPDIYLYNDHSPVEFYVRCVNDGNTGHFINVHFKDMFTGLLQAPIASFWLGAFKDTSILVLTSLNAKVFQQNNPMLVMAGTFADSSIFSHAFMHVHIVAGTKTYRENEPPVFSGAANRMSLYTRYAGSPLQYYELSSNGSINASKAAVKYNANLSYYPTSSGINKLVLSSTMINYQKNNLGVQLGNVYHSQEVSVAGRGATISMAGKNRGEVTAGFINSTYNLLSVNDKTSVFKPSNLFYAGYTSDPGKQFWVTTSLKRIRDSQNGINALLGGGVVTMRLPGKKQELSVGAYTSYSSGEKAIGASSAFAGGSASLSYSGMMGSWQLLSGNYISTKKYAGVQRGALNLDERIGYSGTGWDAWARFNKSYNKPGTLLSHIPFVDNEYGSLTAEIGFQQRLTNRLSYSVRPYLYQESSFNTYSGNSNNVELRAARLSLSVNSSGQSLQSLSVNADGGYFMKAPSVYKNSFSYRINGLYRYRWLSLTALLQQGPYYAGEMRMYYYSGRTYKMFMVSPGIIKNFFRNSVMVTMSDMITYENTYSRWSNNLSLSANLRLPKHYQLELRLNKQQYGINQSLNTIDAGIIKHFSTDRAATTGTGSLHVVFYDDRNGNNQLDAGEPSVPNILIKINEEIFVTGEAGEVSYKSIPNGSYLVSMYQSKGFVAETRPILVKGKSAIHIPLHKMETMEGQILLKRRDLVFETDGNISGIQVSATDRQGIVYSAITNEDGRFTIYAPANDYFLQVVASTMSDKYECGHPGQSIQLRKNVLAQVKLEILVKQRQTKVVKFISKN